MNLRDWYFYKGLIESYLIVFAFFIAICSYQLEMYSLYYISLVVASGLLGYTISQYSNKAYKLESWERQC